MTEIAWLAGRGFATFGLTVAAVHSGADGPVPGDLMLPLWENMVDHIISGREELGFSKLYCDLPVPIEAPGHILCRARWAGLGLGGLRLNDLGEAPSPPAGPSPSQGQ